MGVDVKAGLTQKLTTTAANVQGLNQAHQLLHGKEKYIYTAELKDVSTDWHIAEQSSKARKLKKHPRINGIAIRAEYTENQCTYFC
jgi:IS5 family transposase